MILEGILLSLLALSIGYAATYKVQLEKLKKRNRLVNNNVTLLIRKQNDLKAELHKLKYPCDDKEFIRIGDYTLVRPLTQKDLYKFEDFWLATPNGVQKLPENMIKTYLGLGTVFSSKDAATMWCIAVGWKEELEIAK